MPPRTRNASATDSTQRLTRSRTNQVSAAVPTTTTQGNATKPAGATKAKGKGKKTTASAGETEHRQSPTESANPDQSPDHTLSTSTEAATAQSTGPKPSGKVKASRKGKKVAHPSTAGAEQPQPPTDTATTSVSTREETVIPDAHPSTAEAEQPQPPTDTATTSVSTREETVIPDAHPSTAGAEQPQPPTNTATISVSTREETVIPEDSRPSTSLVSAEHQSSRSQEPRAVEGFNETGVSGDTTPTGNDTGATPTTSLMNDSEPNRELHTPATEQTTLPENPPNHEGGIPPIVRENFYAVADAFELADKVDGATSEFLMAVVR